VTERECHDAMPVGDANAPGPSGAIFPTISAGARADHNTMASPITDSDAWLVQAGRNEAAKKAAHKAWARLTTAVEALGEAGVAAWPGIHRRLADRRIAVSLTARDRLMGRAAQDVVMYGVPRPADKMLARFAKQDRWWAERMARLGGTPEQDARQLWGRIGADLAKLPPRDLPCDDLWSQVADCLDAMASEVASGVAA
jgi:hypothetical protein